MDTIHITKYATTHNGHIIPSYDVSVRGRKVATLDARQTLSDLVEADRELIDFPVYLYPQRDGRVEVVSVPEFLLAENS